MPRLISFFDPRYIGLIYDPGNMIQEGYENWRMGIELLEEFSPGEKLSPLQ